MTLPQRLAAPAPGWTTYADVVVIGSGIAGQLSGGLPTVMTGTAGVLCSCAGLATVVRRTTDVADVAAWETTNLVTVERTALNFLCHLSGVATATSRWVDTVARWVDAVAGTAAQVKDNHVLAAGGVVAADDAVRVRYPDLPVQVEVTTLAELHELLDAGAPEVLLDDLSTSTLTEAVRLTHGRTRLEASGGLILERPREVAQTGVDLIAVGALTHSAPVLDVAMDLRP